MQTDDDVDMTAARGRGLSVAKRGLCLLVGALASWVPTAAAAQAPPGESPSTPDWSLPVAAPDGAPNIVLVLLDDVGFAATSTFGGATPTPSLDRLAAGGLRYNRFHVNPMCSPTRAALLSGRNSHQVGFGRISELASAHPGYNSVWPKASAGIAEVLRRNGYSTVAFGKWHNTPLWEATPAGPFDRWPAGLGFEYFYGFIGPGTSQNAPAAAWAWAVNSPFRGAKQDASYLGGTRAPMVVSWPGHIHSAPGLRSQFLHAVDVAPTLFEIAGIPAPSVVDGVEQTPLEGTSFAPTFDDPDAPSRHRVQYFESFGSRAIYADGWWAGSPNRSPWTQSFGTPSPAPEERPWELYDLERDFNQARDLSGQNPQKLEELKALFDAEARRNGVYPLEPGFGPQPSLTDGRTHFVYYEGARRLPPAAAPQLAGRAHRITAEVVIPDAGAEGVILAQGGRQGGFTLYVEEGRVTYETSAFGQSGGRLVASEPLTPGAAKVVVEVTPAGGPAGPTGFRWSRPMVARLFVDGSGAGESTLVLAHNFATLDVGSDLVSPVSPRYACPFAFTGRIESVAIDLLEDR